MFSPQNSIPGDKINLENDPKNILLQKKLIFAFFLINILIAFSIIISIYTDKQNFRIYFKKTVLLPFMKKQISLFLSKETGIFTGIRKFLKQ